MAFWDSEKSLAAGEPYELHEFRLGETSTYWRYADAPMDISYGGNTFLHLYISGGRIEQGVNALKSRTIVKCDWSNPFAWQYTVCAPEEIIHYVRYKGHGEDVVAVFRGDVVDVVFRQQDRQGNRWAEIVIDPVTAAMQRMGLVSKYSRMCTVELFSTRCGVSRAAYKTSGTLDGVNGNILESTTFGGQSNGYWDGGDIVINGLRRKMIAHNGNYVTIIGTTPGLVAGQSFDAYPGCNHLCGTCHTKFNNRVNFKGQPNIPDENPTSQWGFG